MSELFQKGSEILSLLLFGGMILWMFQLLLAAAGG